MTGLNIDKLEGFKFLSYHLTTLIESLMALPDNLNILSHELNDLFFKLLIFFIKK